MAAANASRAAASTRCWSRRVPRPPIFQAAQVRAFGDHTALGVDVCRRRCPRRHCLGQRALARRQSAIAATSLPRPPAAVVSSLSSQRQRHVAVAGCRGWHGIGAVCLAAPQRRRRRPVWHRSRRSPPRGQALHHRPPRPKLVHGGTQVVVQGRGTVTWPLPFLRSCSHVSFCRFSQAAEQLTGPCVLRSLWCRTCTSSLKACGTCEPACQPVQPAARRSESAVPPCCCLLQAAAAGVCACPSLR